MEKNVDKFMDDLKSNELAVATLVVASHQHPVTKEVAVGVVLDDNDRARLAGLEKVIEDGLGAFQNVVGEALRAIHAQKLYRAEFTTFDDYCKVRWNWSRQRAYQLIGAAKVRRNLSTMVDKPQPTSERQTRSLAKLKPEAQRKVWKKLFSAAQGKAITAEDVESAVEKHLSRKPRATKRRKAKESFVLKTLKNELEFKLGKILRRWPQQHLLHAFESVETVIEQYRHIAAAADQPEVNGSSDNAAIKQ